MNIPQETFDAATAPLRKGVNLVEASAGTGKTFAIAMLVLRFVTEYGFPLQSILVVTFTKAATEELKERIRARLASARDLLSKVGRREDGPKEESLGQRAGIDPALASWRAELSERGVTEPLALHRLELALLDMDLAAVFTIHGFCQRMLQEQALESGQLFDFTLTKDTSRLRTQVIHDYWRRNVYGLSPLHCALITESYSTPDALYKSVQGAGKRGARIEPKGFAVEECLVRLDQSLSQLSDWWQDNAVRLHTFFQEAVDQGKFKQELQGSFSGWWQQVADFLGHNSLQLPARMERLSTCGIMEELHGNKFRSNKEKNSEERKEEFIAAWPLPERALGDFLQARQDVILAFRIGLVRELSTGLTQTLRRQNLLSFDDLIAQLEKALVAPARGKQGTALGQILGNRYQAALIDEFQDTDDAQYSIFSTLFAGAGATSSQYLYLIGDPKQAIYTFRGADIYSYFKAREEAAIHLSLARNYRSHPALVEAVNRLFQLREDAFATPDLPYFPVLPAKSGDERQLLDEGKALAVMVYCELAANSDPDSKDGRWSSTKATERIIAYVVAETARLLRAASPIMLTASASPPMPLAPRDIAILVRSHNQAKQMQTALARAGIPAVMASQQSVFTTDECHDLLRLMQALCSPGDTTLLKSVLTSPWFGLKGPELYALWQAPEQVDAGQGRPSVAGVKDDAGATLWLTRFHDYHQLWQEQGFLAMMTRLLESEKILITLARQPLAETGATRKISNIHHLLELIQAAETEESMGPGKTLQWLQAMREDSRSMEETELRLESDEEAVRIVTMHSAKGLEYPVVFCPFLWHRANYIQGEKGFVTCHDQNRELVIDLGSPLFEERKEQALQEELAEELRLAYVALTRARCRCYAFWAEVKGSSKTAASRDSALAWLLSLEQGRAFAEQIQTLQQQAGDGSVIHALMAADSDETMVMATRKSGAEELMPLSFTGRNLRTDWLLHSYSSLAAPAIPGSHGIRPFLAVSHQPDNQASWADRTDSAELPQAPSEPSLPDLPKGAQMGNVVHGLLENISFATLAEGGGYEEILRQQCAWFGVEASPSRLASLLQKVVQTPLLTSDTGTPFSLTDLKPSETIREMPFYFHLEKSSTEQINTILAGSPTVTPVTSKGLQGYLTGFVDLICRHQGKFYIMDYKSNWLGNHLLDYGHEGLEQAMREHNYGLQYWLYTLVLHRYLQNGLAGYDYSTHFGGVMYLFVRGMEPTIAGSGVYFDLPDRQTLEQLDHCLGRSCAVHGARDTGPSVACGGSKNG